MQIVLKVAHKSLEMQSNHHHPGQKLTTHWRYGLTRREQCRAIFKTKATQNSTSPPESTSSTLETSVKMASSSSKCPRFMKKKKAAVLRNNQKNQEILQISRQIYLTFLSFKVHSTSNQGRNLRRSRWKMTINYFQIVIPIGLKIPRTNKLTSNNKPMPKTLNNHLPWRIISTR